MNIKDLLKSRRAELGLSQLDVAKYVGVSEATVSRWESGNIANMKRDRIYKLANILQINPTMLIGDIHSTPIDTSTVADLDDEEQMLIYCWRQATPEIKENIAFALRSYGMPRPQGKKETEYSTSHGA